MNNKLKLFPIVLILVFLRLTSLLAQGFYVESPDFVTFNAIASLPDGSYVASGNSGSAVYIQKAGPTGQLLWNTNAGIDDAVCTAILPLPNGQTVAALKVNTTNEQLIIQLDINGNLEWATNLPESQNIKLLAATPASEIIAVGNTRSPNGMLQVNLIKLDTDGNILWNTNAGEANADEQAAGVVVLPSGEIILGGMIRNGSETDFFTLKTTADGAFLWEQQYTRVGRQSAYDFMLTRDGNLALLGYEQQINPTQIALLKLDTEGNSLWERHFFLEGGIDLGSDLKISPIPVCLIQDQKGHFFLPLITGPTGYSTGALLHLDEQGYMAGLSAITEMDQINDVAYALDGDLVIAGATSDPAKGVLLKCNDKGQIRNNRVSGGLFSDVNQDCLFNGAEVILSQWVVELRPQTGASLFSRTDEQGKFSISAPEGTFELVVHPPDAGISFWTACEMPTIQLNPGNNSNVWLDYIGIKPVALCPLMEVSVQAGPLSPCSVATWQVWYANHGSADADAAVVKLVKSPYTTFESSTVPLVGVDADTLFFNLGKVDAGESDTFSVQMSISCAAATGTGVCTQVRITPESYCVPPNPSWDQSNIEIEKECIPGEKINFRIRNKGQGNMDNSLEYIIIEDQIILRTGRFQLEGQEDTIFTIDNPTGKAYWARAGQNKDLNILDQPTIFADNCDNSVDNDSLMVQLPNNEADLFLSTHCGILEAPNAAAGIMAGYPLGWKQEHLIDTTQELEYIIGFQNLTGDTVRVVNITDTLPGYLLDCGTFRPGAGSAPFDWDISNNGLVHFRMAGLALPDSSEGFISFRIKPKVGLPLGTVIENTAWVRFNYSPLIGTNTTFHTIGDATVGIHSSIPTIPFHINILPNPFQQYTRIALSGASAGSSVRITLSDMTGRVILTDRFKGGQYLLNGVDLPAGVYFFRLEDGQTGTATGKLIKN